MGKNIRQGFTLVEVIVVLVILAILAAVAVPVLSGYVDTVNQGSCMATLEQVRTAYRVKAMLRQNPESVRAELLTAAANECGCSGVTADGLTFTGSCGGLCTVTYDTNSRRILNIRCSDHAALAAKTEYTALECAVEIKDVLKDAEIVSNETEIYSGVPTPWHNILVSGLPSDVINSLSGKTWIVKGTHADHFQSGILYVYDGDISSMSSGKSVKVTGYRMSNFTEVGEKTAYVGTKTYNGTTYKIFGYIY